MRPVSVFESCCTSLLLCQPRFQFKLYHMDKWIAVNLFLSKTGSCATRASNGPLSISHLSHYSWASHVPYSRERTPRSSRMKKHGETRRIFQARFLFSETSDSHAAHQMKVVAAKPSQGLFGPYFHQFLKAAGSTYCACALRRVRQLCLHAHLYCVCACPCAVPILRKFVSNVSES